MAKTRIQAKLYEFQTIQINNNKNNEDIHQRIPENWGYKVN